MPALEKSHNVKVNGSAMELPASTSIADLLKRLEIETPMVAVELNRQIVSKQDYSTTTIQQGDVLEIVHFVGGG